ncbi:hypothetical protein MKEN_00617400 [Mycena kentingensis (nom. inval.)]|nr:hypothetical protein MKEN_00617400 [Mycena kentingensis (nom. inval.)]
MQPERKLGAPPPVGSWAVMTLDPLASLIQLNLADPKARTRAAQLQRRAKRYVVYISGEATRLDAEDLAHPTALYADESHVELLLQGLPPTDATYGLDAGMCIPVFPEVYHPRPLSGTSRRPPLIVSPPQAQDAQLEEFPFTNAYLAPLSAALRVLSLRRAQPLENVDADPKFWTLSPREQAAHDFWALQDCLRRELLVSTSTSESYGGGAVRDDEPTALASTPQTEHDTPPGSILFTPGLECPGDGDLDVDPEEQFATTLYTESSQKIAFPAMPLPGTPREPTVDDSDAIPGPVISRRPWYANYAISPFPVPDALLERDLQRCAPVPLESFVPIVTFESDLLMIAENGPLRSPEEFFNELRELRNIAADALYRRNHPQVDDEPQLDEFGGAFN